MRGLIWSLAGVLILAAAMAEAHAHLTASNPKEGETVITMPDTISLTFSESARVTAVSIRKNEEPAQKLSPPPVAGTQIIVEIPKLGAGSYTLTWRVESTEDNHIMAGELHFSVPQRKVDMPVSPR